MAYYRICTRCKARLDPQEKNDPCEECLEELQKERAGKKEKEELICAGGKCEHHY